MMKKNAFISAVTLGVLLIFGLTSISFAQLRENVGNDAALSGPTIKQNPSEGADLSNLFNMQMDHSYSMMFSNFGGQMQNMNAYTNTMHFFFTDDLTGRLDVSMLHSPFGNSVMGNDNAMDSQIMIRNAELNYQIGENSNIRFQFQQVPGYGMNPYGMSPWSGYQRSPFNSSIHDPNF